MSDVTEHPVKLGGVHHAAYRCKDAKETVEWYGKVLGMEYTTAFAEDHVPSTGEYDPYMHVFLDAGNGNILAFFELPNQKDMGRDENTPAWVQHLAFKVANEDELLAAKDHVESLGIDVLGPTHHGIFKSIYFFDPNGHRVELAAGWFATKNLLLKAAYVNQNYKDFPAENIYAEGEFNGLMIEAVIGF